MCDIMSGCRTIEMRWTFFLCMIQNVARTRRKVSPAFGILVLFLTLLFVWKVKPHVNYAHVLQPTQAQPSKRIPNKSIM